MITFLIFKNWGLPQVESSTSAQAIAENQLDTVAKQNMIASLCQATGMNEEFSKM